jgi:hypothetical protein
VTRSLMQGLWVHGNLLEGLPDEVGHLTRLRQLSLSGGSCRRHTSLRRAPHRCPLTPSHLSQAPHQLPQLTVRSCRSLQCHTCLHHRAAAPADMTACMQKGPEALARASSPRPLQAMRATGPPIILHLPC